MNLNAHTVSISAYMTLMFTSAFMTLNLPGPLSFAAAAGGLEAAASQLSVKFQAMGMPLPAAPSSSIKTMAAGELKKAADKIEAGNETAKLPRPVCKSLGLNDGSEALVLKSSLVGTLEPRDVRGIQVARLGDKRHVIFSVVLGNKGTWYLADEDGLIKKAVTMTIGGQPEELSIAQAEPAFRTEKTFWVSRLSEGEVLVGRAGS